MLRKMEVFLGSKNSFLEKVFIDLNAGLSRN